MQPTITAEFMQLCINRGTCIDLISTAYRYYYKGLCVVTRGGTASSSNEIITAFWTPSQNVGQIEYKRMLSAPTAVTKHKLLKPATVSLLMLRM
jgi:hypothetical protein